MFKFIVQLSSPEYPGRAKDVFCLCVTKDLVGSDMTSLAAFSNSDGVQSTFICAQGLHTPMAYYQLLGNSFTVHPGHGSCWKGVIG